jgi:superfamily II DNA/RNA helicase
MRQPAGARLRGRRRCRASWGSAERNDALQSLRDGRARVCVATDVAARGLDLPDLGLVVHADLPVNKAGAAAPQGRTGRAGKKGVSVLLVPAYADRAPRDAAPARETSPYVKPRVAREDRPAAPAKPKREYDRPRDAAVPYRPEAQPDRAPFKKPRASDSKGPRESAPYVPAGAAGAAPERPAFKKKRPFEGGPRSDFKKPDGASAARGAFKPGGDFKGGKAKPGIEKSFKGPKKPFKPKNKGNDWKP